MHDQDDGRRDFDFILGRWRVQNRKLVEPLDPSCDRWVEFEAAGDARPLLDGLGNIDTFSAPAMPPHGAPYEGLALRLFDPETRLWRIWWASTRNPGHLDPPLSGRFDERGRGEFYGEEVIAGRAIKVRFRWQPAQPTRWQQDFSFDDGTTWQTNWVMTFTRTGPGSDGDEVGLSLGRIHMQEQPRIEHREEQPYVAIQASVPLQGISAAAERAFPELFAWLEAHEVDPAGAPFIRYLRIDMDRELEIELAVPVASIAQADGERRMGVLPAGRYVTLHHVGPYEGLGSANAFIQEWAREHGVRWQMSDASLWGARVERYLTDPSREPDPTRWVTELAYLAVDD